MKLFVWENPYRVPYGSTAVFAVAETVEQAREVAAKGTSWAYVAFAGQNVSHIELGEPTRVVDVPCAEWHLWSE